MLAFEDNCFCFQVTTFYQKSEVYSNVYKEPPLFDKKIQLETKAIVFKG